MSKLLKPIQNDSSQPNFSNEQAGFDSLSRDVIDLRAELKDQRKENNNFIRWIIVALLGIVVTVAIEVIFFHTRANKDFLNLQNQYFQEVKELQKNHFEAELRLQKKIDALKVDIAKINTEISVKFKSMR